MKSVRMRVLIVCLLVALAVQGGAWELGEGSLIAVRLARAPRLDGIISPGEWEEATCIAPFWYLKEQREADLRTQAYLAYTAQGIYVAFACEDPQPERIHAQEFRRNADLSKDDYVEVAIEPTGLSDAEPFLFRVNAVGTQYDQLPGGSASNLQWRGDWKAVAARHERGWSAEIFIPFRLLRLSKGRRDLFVAFARYVPRLGVTYYYPNMGTVYDALKRARWRGIEAPDVAPRPVVLPYLQVDSTEGHAGWRTGLDVKFGLRGGGTALVTINPDFKNIAAEVDSVAFSYVPRLIPDTRPFFVEGNSFFPDTTLFYSASLREVDIGMKAFGSVNRWSYGMLLSSGEGTRALVGRVGYQIAHRLRGEVQMVYDDRPGLRATALGTGFVAYPSFSDGHGLFGMLYFRTDANNTPVGEKTALSFWRFRGDGRVSYGGYLQQVSNAFSPSLGYAPEAGYRGYDLGATYQDQWVDGTLQQLQAGLHLSQRWRLQGALLDQSIDGWLQAIWRNDMTLWLNAISYRRPPYRDRTLALGVYWNSRRLHNTGGVLVSLGKQVGGNSLFWQLSQGIPFNSRSRLNLRYERSHIEYGLPSVPDRQEHLLIATLTYDLDSERSIGGRYIGRGSDFGRFNEIDTFYLIYRQQVRRGTDIFLIFGDPNASRTQNRFAVKVMTPW